ncbi:hypothetical protein ACN99C_17820 [Pseudomonas alloputida]
MSNQISNHINNQATTKRKPRNHWDVVMKKSDQQPHLNHPIR